MDQTRQWGTDLRDIRRDHVARYEFAATKFKSMMVLDAACGIGYGSWILQQQDNEVTGIDIESEALDWANLYWAGPKYVQQDLEDVLEFGEDEFDAVVSFETLEHLANPKEVLQKFRQAASYLIASVPNQEHYPFDAMKFANDKYPHKRHYTPKQFEDLLDSAGWDVVEKHCQKGKQSDVTWGTDGMFLIYVCR